MLQELDAVPLPADPEAVRPRWLRWLVPLTATAAAAAALFLTVEVRAPAPGPAPLAVVEGLPRPDVALLGAQAKLAEGDAALDTYRQRMGAYRARILKDLRRAYPVRVTRWTPEATRGRARGER